MVALAMAGAEPTWQERQAGEIEERVAKQPAGELLLKAIDAHGGLVPWIDARTLAFDFDYVTPGKPEARRYTRNRVDLFGRRAVQKELGVDADASLGWDGTNAWIHPNSEAFPSDPRFWATTPFYFVGLPWVLADEGAIVNPLDSIVIPETGIKEPLPSLKVSYESGVGDAPDDYYILHLHPTTHKIVAIRYIVTYFSKSAEDRPEKIQLWTGEEVVGGLTFVTHYESHAWDGSVGEKRAVIDAKNFAVGIPIPDEDFKAPKASE